MSTPIFLPSHLKVIWYCGPTVEVEYIDRGHERVNRPPQNLHRVVDVVNPVSQLIWGR